MSATSSQDKTADAGSSSGRSESNVALGENVLAAAFLADVATGQAATVVYIHGADNKPPRDDLKRSGDQDLFGQDMGQRTRMAYYADVLRDRPEDCQATADPGTGPVVGELRRPSGCGHARHHPC